LFFSLAYAKLELNQQDFNFMGWHYSLKKCLSNHSNLFWSNTRYWKPEIGRSCHDDHSFFSIWNL